MSSFLSFSRIMPVEMATSCFMMHCKKLDNFPDQQRTNNPSQQLTTDLRTIRDLTRSEAQETVEQEVVEGATDMDTFSSMTQDMMDTKRTALDFKEAGNRDSIAARMITMVMTAMITDRS